MVPSCAEGGVLGVLPGVVGCLQATEVIKLLLGQGASMIGRLLTYHAMDMKFQRFLKEYREIRIHCNERSDLGFCPGATHAGAAHPNVFGASKRSTRDCMEMARDVHVT